MKFTREDYNQRIIDKAGKIPEDEPVFLLRAQDVHARQPSGIMQSYWMKAGTKRWRMSCVHTHGIWLYGRNP